MDRRIKVLLVLAAIFTTVAIIGCNRGRAETAVGPKIAARAASKTNASNECAGDKSDATSKK
jgi:hypothetical protein